MELELYGIVWNCMELYGIVASVDPAPRRFEVLVLIVCIAVNVYFPPAQRECWSRLAEIYGFRSGCNLFTVNRLLPRAQWTWSSPPTS